MTPHPSSNPTRAPVPATPPVPFADQPLGPSPHIAVFSSSKVGNFVVTTPLLRGLKEKYPACVIDFFGSETTHDFESHCAYIDFRFSLHRTPPLEQPLDALRATARRRIAEAGPYALAINCDGFNELNIEALGQVEAEYVVGRTEVGGGDPASLQQHQILEAPDWNSEAFLARYGDLLDTNYIAEIFCRMAFVETDYVRLEVASRPPAVEVPDVLIHVTTTRSAKMWPLTHWERVIAWCAQKRLSVGLIGSQPDLQRSLYRAGSLEDDLLTRSHMLDLRGQTPLLELAGALERARLFVTVDAGPLHVAAAVGCPTVAIFGNARDGEGASPFRLWAPRLSHVRRAPTTFRCTVCSEHRFTNADCLVAGHPCMTDLAPGAVIGLMAEMLELEA